MDEKMHITRALVGYRSLSRPTACGRYAYITNLVSGVNGATCKECVDAFQDKESGPAPLAPG
jgi:hypothetical protein